MSWYGITQPRGSVGALFRDPFLKAYWELIKSSADNSGNGNSGTDTGVSYLGAPNLRLRFLQSFPSFDGSTSHINTSLALNYTNTTPFSWSAWVYFTNTTTGYVLCSNVTPGAGNLFVDLNKDGYVSGKLSFEIGKSGTGVTHIDSSEAYVVGQWEHYVLTYDGANNMTLYRNGHPVGSASYSQGNAGSSGSGFYMMFASNSTNFVNGRIRNVAIFSRALTVAEVARYWIVAQSQLPTKSWLTNAIAQLFTRTMTDSLMNAASRSSTLARVYLAIRASSDSLMSAASRSDSLARIYLPIRALSDTMMNAASRLATVAKALIRAMTDSIMNGASRSATIARLYLAIRTKSDSLMNGASRSDSLARTYLAFRTLSDSIMNAASRFATVAKGYLRALSDNLMNGAGRLATLSRTYFAIRAPADSFMNAASRLATLTKGFIRTMTDSFMNSAGRLASVAFSRLYIRSMTDTMMNAASRFASKIRAFKNGLDIRYSAKYPARGSKYDKKYPNG
jgi:hypothetical protein